MTDGRNRGWHPEQGYGRQHGQGHTDGDNGTAHNLCADGYAGPDSGRSSADSTVHASPDDACGTARAACFHSAG
jgi:hypothetical protein